LKAGLPAVLRYSAEWLSDRLMQLYVYGYLNRLIAGKRGAKRAPAR